MNKVCNIYIYISTYLHIYIYILKTTQCCVTCWSWSCFFISWRQGIRLHFQVCLHFRTYCNGDPPQTAFQSLLKKANLLRSTAARMLYLAAQRYTSASIWASLRTTVLHCKLLCRHTLRWPSLPELPVLPFWAHTLSPPNQLEKSVTRLKDTANI